MCDKEEIVKLSPKEQAICDKYGSKDNTGRFHCPVCPLALDVGLCKASLSKKEWKRLKKQYEG